MGYFLEERISELIRYGSTWEEGFAVDDTKTSGGSRYASLRHRYPVRTFDASYMLDDARLWTELVGIYMRAYGTLAGFRARCFDEWSSNGAKGTPTHTDQSTIRVSSGIYQLVKLYGTDKTALSGLGHPYRIIKKPVSGTVKIGVNGTLTTSGVSVDYTTGLVTITPAPLITDTVTAGFEFDFPIHFTTKLPVGMDYPGWRPVESLQFEELLNP